MAGVPRSRFDGSAPTQNDQVRQRDLFPSGLRPVELLLDAFQRLQHLGELSRLVDFPVLLRGQADTGAVGAAALVGPAEC